jgi:hypothetical protein
MVNEAETTVGPDSKITQGAKFSEKNETFSGGLSGYFVGVRKSALPARLPYPKIV